ncbi:hypothetical protein L584_04780 [Pantoea agglomerans Tx10]|nr:hypothetical protein L584_04780 [Pantoea agglomerans Tx10]
MRERGDLFPGDNALMAGRKTGVRHFVRSPLQATAMIG